MFNLGHQVGATCGGPSRRSFLKIGGLSLFGLSLPHVLEARAAQAPASRKDVNCILLWMGGGPSQFETFSPKPGHENGGETKAISTAVSGIQIAEHWTRMATVTRELAILRSMTSKEGNHGRATYLLHTGYAPSGGIVHPGFGSHVAKELGRADFDL
ncbi:MAG TPA: DUF1501 domain-containing protein, partial [Gemmataceae bacterium]|nr:DUF1501 domain-containing protein [Gemmataceae bacterium]